VSGAEGGWAAGDLQLGQGVRLEVSSPDLLCQNVFDFQCSEILTESGDPVAPMVMSATAWLLRGSLPCGIWPPHNKSPTKRPCG